MSKQHETTEKVIGENTFYIRPFPAMLSVEVHSDLIVAVAPVFAPLASDKGGGSIADMDISMFLTAMSSLSGEKVVSLLTKLLIKHKNISVETADEGVKPLDRERFDEVFCGDVQDAFILAVEVINVNFKGFFSKIGSQFGIQKATAETKTKPQKSTED